MATYVTLYRFTEQGAKNIKDSVKRADAGRKNAEQFGVKIKEILWTEGQYDIIVISEGSDDLQGAALRLNVLKGGNVTGQTLRAFTADEMEKILAKVA